MIINFTPMEALLIKSTVEERISLYKSTGLNIPDSDENELNSIIEKIENTFNQCFERKVS